RGAPPRGQPAQAGRMTASPPDRLARVALASLGEPGDPRMASLVQQLGAVTLRDHLLAVTTSDGPARDAAEAQMRRDVTVRLAACDPERDLARAERLGIRFVVPGDDEWPRRLDDLFDVETLHDRGGPPLGLWVRGPMRLDELDRSVAIVGSRSATTYGTAAAADIAAGVVHEGYAVVSGAAYGIDQAAHRGALAAGGRTVAVLACGVDRAYPAAHKPMLDHLAERCAVVSEQAPGRSPTRVRFLTRNRLIAALTGGTVVVEAAVRSGALNTAGWASRLHRPLMGVPGPISAAQSEGVHHLVRSGAAVLVTSGAEVLEMLGASGEHLPSRPQGRIHARDRLSTRAQQVLDAVPLHRSAGVESIARTAGIHLLDTQATLTRLERETFVEQVAGGWRIRASQDAQSPAKTPEIPTMDP
ncbi:MAG: DNA-processing protein DprA, partial [Nocardioides sp.]